MYLFIFNFFFLYLSVLFGGQCTWRKRTRAGLARGNWVVSCVGSGPYSSIQIGLLIQYKVLDNIFVLYASKAAVRTEIMIYLSTYLSWTDRRRLHCNLWTIPLQCTLFSKRAVIWFKFMFSVFMIGSRSFLMIWNKFLVYQPDISDISQFACDTYANKAAIRTY